MKLSKVEIFGLIGNRREREITSFYITKDNLNLLNEFSKENNISRSDALNIILRLFFNKIKEYMPGVAG